ncbi:MAG TPA: argininosuccinate lyase [Clostridiales bacterium UBA8153]|nr:argininosuccinate lyase [Clostridiales bacterium UBA8153]
MKLWGGRFAPGAGGQAQRFTASIGFDRRLYQEDIAGSQAHARMLAAQGIITPVEAGSIIDALDEIGQEIGSGQFTFALEDEDIHMNVERRLLEKLGSVGGKLHTARSRNDQVALDMHMFVRNGAAEVVRRITALQSALVDRATVYQDAVMPGCTHLQAAQPVLLAHHLLAYFHMLERDRGRFLECRARANLSPLGACALAGTSFPIAPELVAKELGFDGVYANSIDAVSDRDFVIEFISAAALVMVHLSRLAEELVLWSSQPWAWVELSDAYSTGSSIMPQKKNPDTAELIRGKTGRVVGHLMAMLMVMKGLPLAYNSDMQEDKEGLFDAVDTVNGCLETMAGIVGSLAFNRERALAAAAKGHTTATELADYLVRQGVPFREAHAVVGRLVRLALSRGVELDGLSLADLQGASSCFGPEALQLLDPVAATGAKTSPGGTAPANVARALAVARRVLSER